MRKNTFFKLWLFITLGLTTSMFSSCCSKEDDDVSTSTDWIEINGVKWATRNVDALGKFANTPESSGMFYQWNRKTGWSTTDPIVNSNGSAAWNSSVPAGNTWEKANDPSPLGYHVPTIEEIESLLDTDKVTSEWTIQNGTYGRKFTDIETNNSLFLPAVGERLNNGTLSNIDMSGFYWSSTQSSHYEAYNLGFNDSVAKIRLYPSRAYGFSVRSVADKK